MFGHYSMIVSTLIFAGGAVVIELIFGFHKLKKHFKLLLLVGLFSLAFTPTESVALKLGIWGYGEGTFNTYFLGAEAELYLLAFLSYIAISSAVLILTEHEDQSKPLFNSFRFILRKIVK